MRVEAHVHIGRARKGLATCISSRDLPSGKVEHLSLLRLNKVTFSVQPAGRRKAVESGVKNVHAFVRGTVSTKQTHDPVFANNREFMVSLGWREASYTPGVGYFYDRATGDEVTHAECAVLVGKTLWYC